MEERRRRVPSRYPAKNRIVPNSRVAIRGMQDATEGLRA